ncbi:glutamate-cysteine ligase family protein, partial [Corynebacterium glyciniphilum]
MGTTVRVEEDLHIVDRTARAPAPCADEIVAWLGDVERFSALRDAERLISRTSPNSDLGGLLAELRRNRSLVAQVAGQLDGDCAPLAVGVVPWPRRGVHSTGGLRVTVQCGDGGDGGDGGGGDGGDVLAVCRGVSRHLPALLAVSASSPLDDEGVDTGYASSRALQAPRWPASGAYPEAATMDDYRRDVEFLQHTRVISGPEMMHYDVRPAREAAGGVEIRLCDACSSSATVAVIVALCRALVVRETALVRRGTPTPPLPVLQQRTATWRAA